MSELVLSIFPGLGLLDAGFEAEGFCTVRGPDPLWGGDVREFHPPAGRFDGVIGGDPCQSHSSLANLVRAKGLEPSFPDLTPEYQRVIEEAQPRWFLRENTPRAPDVKPAGYNVRSFLLDLSHLEDEDGWGHEQMRKRRFWFGVREDLGECPELRKWIRFAWFELPDAERQEPCVAGHDHAPGTRDANKRRTQAVASDSRAVAVAVGGSGKRKATARQGPVTGRHEGAVGAPGVDYSPPRRDLAEMLRLQGFPPDHFGELDAKGHPKHSPFTVTGLRKAVGNGVPLPMSRALAGAIREWRQLLVR